MGWSSLGCVEMELDLQGRALLGDVRQRENPTPLSSIELKP